MLHVQLTLLLLWSITLCSHIVSIYTSADFACALCLTESHATKDGQPTHEGVEVDADGYRVEQRTETEQCSQTEEMRELEDGHATEKHRHQTKEVRLEEVKSRESGPRPATLEEIRALLGAEFSGGAGAEIQTSHEITVEEFTRVERKHEKTDSGTGETQTETTTTEGKRTELLSEQPQWKIKAEKSPEPHMEAETKAAAPQQLMSLPIISAAGQGSVDVSLPQATVEVAAPSVTVSSQEPAKQSKSKGGGIFGKFTLTPKRKGVDKPDAEATAGDTVLAQKKPDIAGEVSDEPMDISASASTEWPSEHHKVKHKRHVIEEVVLEDSDKFYEEIHKRPKLFIRPKKKTDKENIEPVVERRRSTGELPESQVPQTGSAANVSSEELVKFVVQYDLGAAKLDEQLPQEKKRWTMPLFAAGKSAETPNVGDKQEEVVVEEEDLFTDTSLERKGFRFGKKKTSQPVAPHSETVTFIVHGDQPGEYVKVEPRMEVDESDVDTDAKASFQGSLEFPKWKLFERKQKTPSDDGETSSLKASGRKWIPNIRLRSKYAKLGKLCAKGDTVAYHNTDATLPEDTNVHEIKWPLLKVHFGGKYVMTTDVSTGEAKPDTETYVIEHIEQLPRDSDPDTMDIDARFPRLQFALNRPLPHSPEGESYVIYEVEHPTDSGVSADDKSRDSMQWPDLKFVFKAPPSGEIEDEGQKLEARMPVYIVSQILPVPSVTAGSESAQGFKAPNVQLQFGTIADAAEEQKITYIVEHPDRPVSLVEGQGSSTFELPKFKPHFGTWPGKHGDAAVTVCSASLTSIDELPGEVHRESVVTWPKLKFHFDGKPTKDGSQIIADKEIVSYVVEHQMPTPGVSSDVSGGTQWPTVGLDFNTKSATVIDASDYSDKTLTYTAESGSLKASGDKANTTQTLRWPKFNVHFDTKPTQRHSQESSPISYTFAQPVDVNLSKVDSRGNIHLPKFGMHIASKRPRLKASDSLQEPETVTYIVEVPAPEAQGKHLQIVWPKVDFRLGKTTKIEEKEQEVEPEVVTYIIEQPLSTESDAVDSKTRFRIEWPKFNLQFGAKQKRPEDIPVETEGAYVVQEIVPEPSADENKPAFHWPKLKIRFGAKSDDKHPDMEAIDETVTYVVQQSSPDVRGRARTGIHLPTPSGKSFAEEQTVTYVVESPTTTDSLSDRQHRFRVKLPKLNVHFGLKKVKYGEGNGDTSGEMVTYVVEQIVPVDRDSQRVKAGIDWPRFRRQFGRKTKDKDDISDTSEEEIVTYIVEAPIPLEEPKSGFGISVPKPKVDLRFLKKTKKYEGEMDTESDNTPYVLEQEMRVNTKLQIEWPKFSYHHFKRKTTVEGDAGAAYVVEEIAPVPTEHSTDVSGPGGLQWPKLNVRFRSKTTGGKGEKETKTVSYVLEQPSAELSESGGYRWPKLNLHFGGKASEKAGATPETVNYVVEQQPELPTDGAEGQEKLGLKWPKLKVQLALKSVEHTIELDEKVEKVTYAVEQIVPVHGDTEAKKVGGGIEWPKLRWNFGGKTSCKVDDDLEAEAETVTYIVEAPALQEEPKAGFGISVPRPNIDLRFAKKTKKHEDEIDTDSENAPYVLEQDMPDQSGGGDMKRRLHIEWPKFKLPHFKGKAAVDGDGGVAYVVEEIAAVPTEDSHDVSATGGIRWPKLNVRFGSKTPSAEGAVETNTVTYVVEQPSAEISESGGFRWPKFNLNLSRKAGEKTAGTPETVTYVVKQTAEEPRDAGDEKGKISLSWPKLKVDFALKSVEHDTAELGEKVEKVTYAVEQMVPVIDSGGDKNVFSGIEWPKLHWHVGWKSLEKLCAEHEQEMETVTYIVEAQRLPEERKGGFGISVPKPKIDLRFGKKPKKDEDVMDTESENAPYIVEQDMPDQSGAGDMKRRLHIEWPKFKFPRFRGKAAVQGDGGGAYFVEEVAAVPTEDSHDVSATGGIRWPKLNVRFGSKTPSAEGATEPNMVTYVVEQPSAEISESGGFRWPNFSLHLPGKAGEKPTGTAETVTYVVEQPTDTGDGNGKVSLSWPKLKVHFGLKSVEHGTAELGEKVEKVTYAVQQMVPVPDSGGDKKVFSGIVWPKFHWHFGGKSSEKVGAEHEGEAETITYIVEATGLPEERKGGFGISVPKPKIDLRFRKKPKKHEDEMDTESENAPYVIEQDMPDQSGAGDMKRRLQIEWPNFKFPRFKGKAAVGDGGAAYVVEEIAAVPTEGSQDVSATGGFRWPKLNVRFGSKTPDAEGATEANTVTYVVEQPSAEISESGGFRWPKFNLHLPGKAGEKPTGDAETVTYVVEQPTDSGDEKGKVSLSWPKLKVHFGLKSVEHGTAELGEKVEKVTYAVEQMVPVPDSVGGKKIFSGIEWPKFHWHFGGKATEEITAEHEEAETVTYIVEAPRLPEETKSGFGISLPKPKIDLRFGKKPKKQEDEMDTESDTAPYVLEQDMPGQSGAGDMKRRLYIEWPKFKFPHFKGKPEAGDEGGAYVVEEIAAVPTDHDDDVSTTGGIRWPKLNVRFGSRTPNAEGATETNTVTYVVEQPSTKISKSGGFQWPKFNLHLPGKTGEKPTGTAETVTYAVEQPTDTGDGRGKVSLTWPKLKVHFGLKSVEHVTAELGEKVEKVTYAVEQMVPVPDSVGDKKIFSGIEWPKFHWHFGGKSSEKVAAEHEFGGKSEKVDAEDEGEAETVTYIVEAPGLPEDRKGGFGISVPKPKIDFRFGKKAKKHEDEMDTESKNAPYVLEQDMPDQSGTGDMKRRLQIEWPKFKFPRFKGKAAAEGDGGAVYVVEEIAAVPSEDSHDVLATGGIRWPKLSVRFGSKTPSAEGASETNTVTYVVQQPSTGISESGGFRWPKFNLHLSGKAGGKPTGDAEMVTYVVEQPSDTGDGKGKVSQSWPKLNVHFGLKSVEHGTAELGEKVEKVTYAVEQMVPVPDSVGDKKVFSGIEWPKFHWHFGGKSSEKGGAEHKGEAETITYIVEAPGLPEERKSGFGISVPKPKIDLRFGKKPKKYENEMDTESENAPYVVEQDMPDQSGAGDMKRRLQIEWPKFKFPRFKGKAAVEVDGGAAYVVEEIAAVPTEDSHDVSATGGIRWPKLNVRFGSKTLSAEGATETNTVTYVVEQPSAEISESGGFRWPKFNLHLPGKAGEKPTGDAETVTYVVEQPTDGGDGKGKVSLSWPKLKVHLGLKSVEHGTAELGEKVEKVTYAVEQMVPVPDSVGDKKVFSGIEWPKFHWHFGGKSSEKVAAEHEGEAETVTYIVEGPALSEERKGGFGVSMSKPKIDLPLWKKRKEHEGEMGTESEYPPYVMDQEMPVESGSGDVKAKLHIEWPTFKFPRFKGKPAVEGDDGAAYVVEEIAPVQTQDSHDVSATGGIRWPKLNVRFGRKAPSAEGDTETKTVTYVVEQPSAEISKSGGFQWPKFNLHLAGKAGEKTTGTPEVVTYVAEQPTEPPTGAGDGKGKVGLSWPKLKVHFGLKSAEQDTADVEKGGKVTYVVEQIVPVSPEVENKKVSGGVERPKLRFHLTHKTSGKYVVNDAKDTETVTYIVEDHGPSLEDVKPGLSIPKAQKFDFKLGRRKTPELYVDAEQIPYVVEQQMPGVSGSKEKDANTRLRIEWPKFKSNLRDMSSRDKNGGKAPILKEVIPVAAEDGDDGSTTGGIRWPKLNARFCGIKTPDVAGDADADTNVTYVVESPFPTDSTSADEQRKYWPQFNLNVTGKAAIKDPSLSADQSVTYVVDRSAEPSPVVADSHSSGLPKLKVHFGLKSVEPRDANNEDAGEIVTYTVDHISPEPVQFRRDDASFGIDWPKFKLHRDKKAADVQRKGVSEPEQTVTYIIEQPDVWHTEEDKGGFGITFPKVNLGGKIGRKESDRDESVRPTGTETGDVERSKGGSWFGGSFSLGKLSLTRKGDLPDADKKTVEPTAELNISGSVPSVEVAADSSFGVDVDRRETRELITSTPIRTVPAADVSIPSIDTEASSSFRLSGGTDLFGGGSVGVEVQIQPMVARSTAATAMASPGGSSQVSTDVDWRSPSPPGGVSSRTVATRGSPLPPWQTPHFVIVAIDFGTAFSGYAFCFPRDVSAATSAGEPLPTIHVMRKWEGGDPGAIDMKTPTILLLTPEREFHSFGFTARDFYHDLSPAESLRWLYFEKFKMALHYYTVSWYICLYRSNIRFDTIRYV